MRQTISPQLAVAASLATFAMAAFALLGQPRPDHSAFAQALSSGQTIEAAGVLPDPGRLLPRLN